MGKHKLTAQELREGVLSDKHKVEISPPSNGKAGHHQPKNVQQKSPSKNDNENDADTFQPVEPCDRPVNGHDMANHILNVLNMYLVLPEHTPEAITLWILFSYVYDDFDVCPILAITSPEKRCGKTSLLALLDALCQKVLAGSNITSAATFRAVEKWHPTLLVDEADTFLKQQDELRGILNSGHTRPTAFVTRAVQKGKKFDVERFSTWTPKAIALIGRLSDTLADRSIIVKMRRKRGDEQRARIKYSKLHIELESTRRKIARWANDADLNIEVGIPDKLDDRAADNWLPLLTIAEQIGWTQQATKAALALSGGTDTDTYRTELLKDIHTIFEQSGNDKIFTKTLLEKLNGDLEKPWCEFNHGSPMSAHKLASMLRPFDVGSVDVHLNGEHKKGYSKNDFQDAFDRYL